MSEPGGESFSGPLFIVGMPRSGTKLLRGLLNRHSRIGIPEAETLFFPWWIERWDKFGDLSQRAVFSRFYRQMLTLPYFSYMRQLRGVITEQGWYDACQSFSPAGVFEALVRHDASATGDCLWGDKSPSYLQHLTLLKEHFPTARFIHIVRDVRDFCLSTKGAWGKNMIRAAQQWTDRVAGARYYGPTLAPDYLELRYEDLLTDTEAVLRHICTFLDIKFEPAMMTLGKSVENLGDAKEENELLRSNVCKYRNVMREVTRRRIESVAAAQLRELDYETAYHGESVRVPRLMMRLYQIVDGMNLLRFEIRERGWVEALQLRWKLFTTSRYSG